MLAHFGSKHMNFVYTNLKFYTNKMLNDITFNLVK